MLVISFMGRESQKKEVQYDFLLCDSNVTVTEGTKLQQQGKTAKKGKKGGIKPMYSLACKRSRVRFSNPQQLVPKFHQTRHFQSR